ncbi:MAG: biopolymer transporter ExbD [Flavobacteriia bacterium]|nr:biopolymer transporter ExbD [Flavobacteriia bacterium]
MAIKRNKRFHVEVATSALSDIMFFLLLFFLIISTLANPNVIKVPLPKSDANEKTKKQHVTLTVTQDKKYFVNKEEVTREGIEQKLLIETAKLNDQTVILRIPKSSEVQELVDLLGLGMKNNLKIIIATTEE